LSGGVPNGDRLDVHHGLSPQSANTVAGVPETAHHRPKKLARVAQAAKSSVGGLGSSPRRLRARRPVKIVAPSRTIVPCASPNITASVTVVLSVGARPEISLTSRGCARTQPAI